MRHAPSLLSERFRPEFQWTLDQIAMILSVPIDRIEEYVFMVGISKEPIKNRMLAHNISEWPNIDYRVPESELNKFGQRKGLRGVSMVE